MGTSYGLWKSLTYELKKGHEKCQYSATFLRELLGAGDPGRVLEEVGAEVLGAVLARVQPRHHGHQRAGVLLQLALYTRHNRRLKSVKMGILTLEQCNMQ